MPTFFAPWQQTALQKTANECHKSTLASDALRRR